LANQQWSEPWEILIVNNRSTDSTMEIVDQYRKEVMYGRTRVFSNMK